MKREEIGAFFKSYGPMVFRRARRLLGNDSDAEEATQEVFIRALKAIDRYDGRCQISTWLYRITTNFCLNKLRDSQRRQQLFDQRVAKSLDTFTNPANSADMALVRRLLSEAPEQRWADAAVYVYVDGMSHKEASELLSVSKRTVGNLLERFNQWAIEHFGDTEVPSVAPENPKTSEQRETGGA